MALQLLQRRLRHRYTLHGRGGLSRCIPWPCRPQHLLRCLGPSPADFEADGAEERDL